MTCACVCGEERAGRGNEGVRYIGSELEKVETKKDTKGERESIKL